jgi:hypothetical protein
MLRYYLSRNGLPDPLAFQDRVASAQQHTESMKGLMRLKLDEVLVPGHPAGDLTYGALITEFSEKFGNAFGRLIGVLRGHASDEILGFDFLELVSATPDGVILPKQLQVKASVDAWSSLVGNADVVFCKGLGDVIIPGGSVTRTICQYIQRPLSGSNLLVCPVYLLKRRLEQQGCTFHDGFIVKSNRYKWVFRGNPFQCSQTGCSRKDCWKDRVQQISADTFAVRAFRRLLGRDSQDSDCSISLGEEGAICFGKVCGHRQWLM